MEELEKICDYGIKCLKQKEDILEEIKENEISNEIIRTDNYIAIITIINKE